MPNREVKYIWGFYTNAMIIYAGTIIFYFIYDRIKSKLTYFIWRNTQIKLIKYTEKWHNSNDKCYVARLLDFIFYDDYF